MERSMQTDGPFCWSTLQEEPYCQLSSGINPLTIAMVVFVHPFDLHTVDRMAFTTPNYSPICLALSSLCWRWTLRRMRTWQRLSQLNLFQLSRFTKTVSRWKSYWDPLQKLSSMPSATLACSPKTSILKKHFSRKCLPSQKIRTRALHQIID